MTEIWDEDEFDGAGVVQPGRRSDPAAGFEPVPQPPLDRPPLAGAAGGVIGQVLVPGRTSGGLGGVSAAADAFGAAEHVRRGAVEVPGAVPAFGQAGTMLL